MSIVPPIAAFFGGGVPSAIIDLMPTISPGKALLGSIFLFNAPHMMCMYIKMKAAGMPDNKDPRAQTDELKKDPQYGGVLARALAAHQNGLESFPPFAAGVLACLATGADAVKAGQLAAFHLFSRVGFNFFYFGLEPSDAVGACRTLSWVMSLLSSCQLIMLATKKAGN
eukprot:TRINITY_DN18875_c1_g1_i1.p1 TRINITY_DN18875_c1_g1~~TRINITY_DN18875_c1_g1_i1.p1  ORF type:complete len:169 (-),score=31.60 TRINITY_DN18875_c1_g1_i1:179-685(-)